MPVNKGKGINHGNYHWRMKKLMPLPAIRVKRLEDFSEDEIRAMEVKYGAKIRRPGKSTAEK